MEQTLIDMRLNVWLLRVTGLLGLEGAAWTALSHRLYTALGAAAYLLLVTSALVALVWDWGDLDAVVDNTCITLPVVFSTARCLYFVARRRRVARLLAELLRFQDYYCPETVKAERVSILTKVSRDARAVTIFFNILAGLLFVTISASPVMAARLAAPSAEVKWLLPVKTAYFDYQRSPHYEAVYVFQVLTLMLLIFSVLTFDTSCMALLMHASAQFRVLATIVRNVRRVAVDGVEQRGSLVASRGATVLNQQEGDVTKSVVSGALETNRLMRHCLVHCVQHHNAITRFVEELDSVYNPVMLGLIVYSMIVIAINSFKITESSADIGDLLKFSAVAGTGLFELYFFCQLCDDIIQQSQEVADAACSCDWCDADADVKRVLQMIITRANKPVTITAGRFRLMSLETYAAIMNSSYSFFAMLKQLNK